MKILIVGVGPWNDIQYGNNVMTNWFYGYEAEFANIYVHTGYPCNSICEKYLQITDSMMMYSFIGDKAGTVFSMTYEEQQNRTKQEGLYVQYTNLERKAKSLPTDIANFARDFVWLLGKINKNTVKKFVQDFNPDIVFCHRVFNFNFWRVERLVRKYTDAPIVAFTGDAEASLNKVRYSPLFWIRQITLNRLLKHHIKIYEHYFTFCEEQALRYIKLSGKPASTLYKCADFPDHFESKPLGRPIRLVYAGNIIYNRWETLAALSDALEIINRDGEVMVLDIYTNTQLTKKMAKKFENRRATVVHGRVTPSELDEIYKKADIALHIESFTKKYRLDTKDSFSTKIVDLMNSTCAIMAVCWEYHNGLQYLQREDAAICVSDLNKMLEVLENISNNPTIIQTYARKAWDCGKRNHSRDVIQNHIKEVFENITQKA